MLVYKCRKLLVMLLFFSLVNVFTYSCKAESAKGSTIMENALRVGSITTTAISPDGAMTLYLVNRPNDAMTEYISALFVAKGDGHKTQAVFTDSSVSANDPQWSPSGKFFAVQARGAVCIFAADEVKLLKEVKSEEGILFYRWGKDDNSLWLVTGKNDYNGNAPLDVGQFGGESTIWSVDIKNGSMQKIACEKDGSIVDVCRSLTGDKLLYAHQANDLYNNAADRINIADAVTKTSVCLTKGEKISLLSFAGCMADDKAVFIGLRKYPYYALTDMPAVMTVNIKNGAVQRLLFPLGNDSKRLEMKVFNDGKSLFGRVEQGSETMLFTYNNGALNGVETVPRHIANISVSNKGKAAFVKQDFIEAPEVFVTKTDVLSMNGYEAQQISMVNKGEKDIKLPKVELVKWKSDDNRMIEGALVYPDDYHSGERYPLVTFTFGPAASVMHSYIGSMDMLAYGVRFPYPLPELTQKGYMVLWANCVETSEDDHRAQPQSGGELLQSYCRNVQSGIDMLEKSGVADESRLSIMGWSMGGFVAASLATMPDNKFKAAVVGDGMYDWVAMFANSNCFEYENLFGGGFWQSSELFNSYTDNSPIRHIQNMQAAMLILHGTDDTVVPVLQAREFYYALRLAGKKVKMTEYPHTDHVITEPQYSLYAAKEILAWLGENCR